MREIKFRGKATMTIEELDEMHFDHDNGWFTGNLVMQGDIPYIVGDFIEVDTEYTINDFWVKVHPESVGQYTGLKDKNGKEIYEGDVVSTDLSRPYIIVEFRDGAFMFQCRDNGEDYYDIMLPILKEKQTHYKYGEVIGNIYENSELLEGEE